MPRRRLDDETVLVDPQSRKLFVMNAVGALVWAGVERGADADEIAAEVTARFRVDVERARADVRGYFDRLVESGLAAWAGTSPP